MMACESSSKLLLDERPLIVLPSLARLVGVNEAIFLQQIHYWCRLFRDLGDSRHYHHGRWWVWNPVESARGDKCWCEQFPFWSPSTIRRIVARLRRRGLLLIDRFNLKRYDRTSWYAIDYEALERAFAAEEEKAERARQESRPSCQLDMMDLFNLSGSIMSDCTNGSCQDDQMDHVEMTTPIPENTREKGGEENKERSPTLHEIWARAGRELEMTVTRSTYDTWIRRAALIRLQAVDGTRQAVIACQDGYVVDWLRSRLDVVIRRALAGAIGVEADNVEIEYREVDDDDKKQVA